MQVIKNTEELGTTPLRKDALDILEAGYQAILTDKVVREKVTRDENILRIQGTEIHLDDYKHVFIVGIGKCALDACTALEDMLEDRLVGGMVLDVRALGPTAEGGLGAGKAPSKIKKYVGTHPLPSEHNVRAAQSVADLLESMTSEDLVLTVISGGGSALLCLPNDLACEELADLTKALMYKGASISEINAVRKHTSKLQGGQFARLAYPAHVVSLIFSDVPGDDLSTIASGPTVKDSTTAKDAQSILDKYKVLNVCNLPDCRLIETPKDEKYFERVKNILVLSNKTALVAMKERAKVLGYATTIETTSLEGNVQELSNQLIQEADEPKTCKLYGGEVTVVVRNKDGKGGRNQELVLRALEHITDDVLFVAAASDGWDNTDVAGALADTTLRKEAEAQHVSIQEHLESNSSYYFFKRVGGHIVTGKTGVNVSDLYFTLRQ